MKTVFADTYYLFALVNHKDEAHVKATAFLNAYNGRLVTTGWVLTEFADGLCRSSAQRAVVVSLIDELSDNPNVKIVEMSHDLFLQGLELYSSRTDKEWSLTDCISFMVMRREQIAEALTGDHHFEQASFVPLLK